MGFTITFKGNPVIVIDYNPVLSFINGRCSLTILNSYIPEARNGFLKLPSCEFDPKCLGCNSVTAKELVLLWDEFQSDGYNLDKISESLLLYDINEFLRGTGCQLLIPSIIEPIILIDSINSCNSIKGIM